MSVTPCDPASDAQLVAAALSGTAAAWTELVDRHLRPTFAVAAAVTGAHSDAEDLVQDAFLHAFGDLHQLRDPERFGAWLAGIVRRQALHRYRIGRRRGEILTEYAQWKDAVQNPEPEEADFDAMWQAIEHLPEALRVPLLLYYFEGESTESVAARLELPAPTVRKRLQLARDRMRDRLEDVWRRRVGSVGPSPAVRGAILLAAASTFAIGRESHAAAADDASEAPATASASTATAKTSKALSALFLVIGLAGVALLWNVLGGGPSDSASPFDSASLATAKREGATTGARDAASAVDGGGSGGGATLVQTRTLPGTLSDDGARDARTAPHPQQLAVIEGRLSWPGGDPVVGRQLSLGKSERFWSLTTEQTVVTDAEGAFRFVVADETDCWLYLDDGVTCTCLKNSWIRPSFAQPTQVEIEVARGFELMTEVVDASSGRRIAGARVVLSTPTPNQQGESFAVTDTAGQALLPLLPEGTYQVVVSHPEFTSHVGYCELPLVESLRIELSPARLLHLQVTGLPVDHDRAVRLSLRRATQAETSDPAASAVPANDPRAALFVNREELFLAGVVDQFGWVSLLAPPVGLWEATFYETLDRRRFDLNIPAVDPTRAGAAVVRRVHLDEGGEVSGWVTGIAAPPESGATEMFLAALTGSLEQELCVPVGADGAFRFRGVRPGSYVVGVRHVVGGWPLDGMTQPRWVSFLHQRVDVDAKAPTEVRLLGAASSGMMLQLPPRSLRSTSLVVIRVTPEDAGAEFFSYPVQSARAGDESTRNSQSVTAPDATRAEALHAAADRHGDDAQGALAIVYAAELPDFRELPPGRYLVESALDGEVLQPTVIELLPEGEDAVPLQLQSLVAAAAETRAPLLLSELLADVRAPRAKTTERIKSGLHAPNTRQVFVPAFSDFHGWHFVRSRFIAALPPDAADLEPVTRAVRDGPAARPVTTPGPSHRSERSR